MQRTLAGPLTALKRHAERAAHDAATVHAIIDEALVCHLAFALEGHAVVLPTAHVRLGDIIYVHGAKANRMISALKTAGRASATFTLLDGLVLARTAFHHSMNYRSAVVFGPVRDVTDIAEKSAALAALVEHVAPGRMAELSEPTEGELKATAVLALHIEQASAKIRKGPPLDGPDEHALDVWAGIVPLELRARQPERDRALGPRHLTSPAARSLAAHSGVPFVERFAGEYLMTSDESRLNFEFVHRYLSETSYWARGISETKLRTALRHSVCFGVYRGLEQVGFARAVTDHARFAYLADVFIVDPHRSQGLGRALIELMLTHPALSTVTRTLLGTRDAHAFYEQFGFTTDAQGRFMERTGL